MKNQALFSSKDKSKKSKCRLLQFLFGALRVNSSFPFEFNTVLFYPSGRGSRSAKIVVLLQYLK